MSTPGDDKKPLMFIQLARKSVQIHTGIVNTLFGICVFAIAITTFASNSSSTASCLAPSPPSDPACNPTKMRGYISMCERWLACFIVLSLISINVVRILVESAHEAHQWVAKEEEAKYKAAKDAYELARRKLEKFNGPLSHRNREARDPAAEQPHLGAAALNAAQEEHDRLFTDEKLAKREMKRLVQKQGMERIEGWPLVVIRGLFFFSVLCSQISCGFATAGFYYSRQIESRCALGPLDILAFVLIGIVSLPYHLFLFWVSLRGN
ncbi:hypothetical protein CFC21_100417 [Triticum aestivum]|uniref:Uncharacterized protein n=3 Tax=Triticum TaxID=4564 RepID=A0A9R0ZQU8_TRITD|nr:hypothetical protein CFC21_100417 [Triticum aestivum]VAI81219.1 unnamed protein product [Triticum turgidum subsp. durum]